MSEETKHEWQRRIVARSGAIWKAFYSNDEWFSHLREYGDVTTETIIQRRRRRDHLDPTACEGIEDPVWRDWVASDDPDIQGVLISKGMPFRSLEK